MHVEFVTFQKAAVPPSRPDVERIFSRFPDARRCPPFAPTVTAGLWIYPPFDATVFIDSQGGFEVIVEDAFAALGWMHRMEELVDWASTWWCSKITGVLQIDPGLIISTQPGERLVVTQPINLFDGWHWTQTGIIDSDFFWAPFTINLVPTPGISRFELRRSIPIAQLLSPMNMLSSMSFDLTEIESRPEMLAFWRSYIDAVFGSKRTDTDEKRARRQQSVYREWLARNKCRAPAASTPGSQ